MHSSQRTGMHCHRTPNEKEILRDLAGLDFIEHALLSTARHFLQSFAMPHSQAWVDGLSLAQISFGKNQGPIVGIRLLTAMQAMRCTRRSVFQFSAPDCLGCSEILTEHERRFMRAIQMERREESQKAKLEIMLLCEGSPSDHVHVAFVDLVAILPTVDVVATEIPHGTYPS